MYFILIGQKILPSWLWEISLKAYSSDNPVQKHIKTFYIQVYEMVSFKAF